MYLILPEWVYNTLSRPSFERLLILMFSWIVVSSKALTYLSTYSALKFLILDFYNDSWRVMNLPTWVHKSFLSLYFTYKSCNYLFWSGVIPINFWTLLKISFFYLNTAIFFSIPSHYLSAYWAGQFSLTKLSFMRVDSRPLMDFDIIPSSFSIIWIISAFLVSIVSVAFLISPCKIKYFSLRSWSSLAWSGLILP